MGVIVGRSPENSASTRSLMGSGQQPDEIARVFLDDIDGHDTRGLNGIHGQEAVVLVTELTHGL